MPETSISAAGPNQALSACSDGAELSWQSALRRLGNQPDLYACHARGFVDQLAGERIEIGEHLLRGELQAATERLHTLRGVAETLGADELAGAAKALEVAIREGRSHAEVADLIDRFERLSSSTRQRLRHLAEQLDPESSTAPLDMGPRPPSVVASEPLSAGEGEATRPRILVVDDQQVNNLVLYQLLHPAHEVLMATSGLQALELAQRLSPDLIVLDILMPGIDGLEVCRRLKNDTKTHDIPVIFVTSRDTPDEEASGLRVGAVDFICKPFSGAVVEARVRTHLMLKAQSDMLRSMAFVDALTGVHNRRRFDQQLDLEWRAACRNRAPLSVLMIDVDHFKGYNDRYGHPAGDQCLRRIAQSLQSSLRRPRDFLARYGGEEFACLLPETDLSGAAIKARQMLRTIESLRICHAKDEVSAFVTASIGVASSSTGSTAAELLASADTQLYRAKKEGRNRVAAPPDRQPLGPRPMGMQGPGTQWQAPMSSLRH